MKIPYPPQQKLIQHSVEGLRKFKAYCNTSSTGTGKTLCSIEACRELGLPGFVVCPKVVVPAWRKAFAEQGVKCIDVVGWEKLRAGNTAHVTRVGKTFHWKVPECVIIFDEAHKAQGAKSLNSKLMISAKMSQRPVIMCSATLAEDPTDMKAAGYLLGLHRLTDFVTWAQAHGCDFDFWGSLTFTGSESLAKVHLQKLNAAIYDAGKGGKLTRADLAGHFQECSIIDDPIEFDDELNRIYSEMGDEITVVDAEMKLDMKKARDRAKARGEDPANVEVNALTKLLRMRQRVELLKVPVILDMVEDARREHLSVAVFANFDATLDAIKERLKEPCSQIRGGQKESERGFEVERFQLNHHRIILCNTEAGGTGVSLHDEHGNHPRMSIISPNFNAKTLEQVLGRVDRAGSQTPSVQRLLVAAGTIEERIMESIRMKLNNLSTLHTYNIRNFSLTEETQPIPSPTLPMSELPISELVYQDSEPKEAAAVAVVEEPAHAEFGPSTLKYFEIAPMYRPRKGENNEAAEKGTRIHLACETGNLDELVDEERLIAEKMLQGVEVILKRHKLELGKCEDHREIRLTMKCPNGIETFGTCDRLIINGTEAVMIDYKTGRNGVEDPEINAQTQAYVAGAFQRFPKLQTIHFYFILPVRDEIMFGTYKLDQLPSLLLRISTIIERARTATSCNPQPGVCDFCALQATCQHLADKALLIARKYQFDGYSVPDTVHSSEVTDPETMGQLLTLSRLMKDWSDSVRFRANQMAFDEGMEIPGFVKLQVKGKSQILSTPGAYEVLKSEINIDDFLACSNLDLGKLEELVRSRAPKRGKSKASESLVDKLTDAGLLAQGEGSYQLRVKRK